MTNFIRMNKEEFKKSLSARDDDIISFLPYLNQDLWELGGRPDIQLKLIQLLNLIEPKILDLGCGKGSSLIKILHHHTGTGLGVDLEPSFINDAVAKAKEWDLTDRIVFNLENLMDTLNQGETFHVVLYGIDSDILGETEDTFRQLRQVVKPNHFVIVETIFPVDEENADDSLPIREDFNKAVKRAGFQVLKEEIWDVDELKASNQLNTQNITQRALELSNLYPAKKNLFDEYVNDQIEECWELENDFECATVLCRLTL